MYHSPVTTAGQRAMDSPPNSVTDTVLTVPGPEGMHIFHFNSTVKMFSVKVNIETARVVLQT